MSNKLTEKELEIVEFVINRLSKIDEASNKESQINSLIDSVDRLNMIINKNK